MHIFAQYDDYLTIEFNKHISKGSKVGDRTQERPECSLSNSYYTEV